MPIIQPPNIHYPINLLDVGDSFFVPVVDADEQTRMFRRLAKELEIEVTCHAGIDRASGLYGLRVVRTT